MYYIMSRMEIRVISNLKNWVQKFKTHMPIGTTIAFNIRLRSQSPVTLLIEWGSTFELIWWNDIVAYI